MKKIALAALIIVAALSSKGRVAWYGEREFLDSVKALEDEGYTIKYIDTLDEETLSFFDGLVICFAEPSQKEKDTVLTFVEKGGGLLIIYNAIQYPEANHVFSQYGLEKTLDTESDIVFPFLAKETVEEMKKRIAVSQKGRGRIITVGYDPLTFQTISLLVDVDRIFSFGLSWLCQDWHVKMTQQLLARRRIAIIVPVLVVAVGLVGGYYLYRRRKKRPDKAEKIRELKARFVYGELSRDEYQKELEKLGGVHGKGLDKE